MWALTVRRTMRSCRGTPWGAQGHAMACPYDKRHDTR